MADHDHSYRHIFSHASVVEDLLKGFIHEDWAQHLDYTTLEKENNSYVTEDLRDRIDDVVWRIKLRDGRWLYLYLLIEFQSSVDPWMAVRIMVYVGLLYQDLIKSGAVKSGDKPLDAKLPPVFPIVIYNGEGRWTAKRDIADLIQTVSGPLAGYQPRQKYWLLDEGRVPAEALPDLPNTVAEIIRLETSPEPEDMRRVIARLVKNLAGPEYDSLRRALTVWMKRVLLKRLLPGEEVPEINDLQEVETMLAERVEQWTSRWEQRGMERGMQRGEAAVLERQLLKRFGSLDESLRLRLNTATLEQLEVWTDRILDAVRIEDVFESH